MHLCIIVYDNSHPNLITSPYTYLLLFILICCMILFITVLIIDIESVLFRLVFCYIYLVTSYFNSMLNQYYALLLPYTTGRSYRNILQVK